MGFECSARVNGILTIIIMGITTTFLRSAARPMLHHCVHTVVTPSVCNLGLACTGLETVHICAGHIRIKFRTFTECAVETCPAGLGRKIDLWGKCSSDT